MCAEGFSIDRRTAVAGIGAAAVALTVGGAAAGRSKAAAAPAQQPVGGPGCAAMPTEVAKTRDVPVGSGVILGDLVLTQPAAGDFRAFCATCTHLGCHLSTVRDGTVNCRCHGSRFHLDGTVARGPAMFPLVPRVVRVQGDAIVLEPWARGIDLPCLPSIPPEQFPEFL
ncbi:MAG: Rieske (2Fe-2S) protein [Aldersonia sp.]|nr:Rieske (2Fe-2S) protein [Aldersonia sp.]